MNTPSAESPKAWLVSEDWVLPDDWRSRARIAYVVPVLPEELGRLSSNESLVVDRNELPLVSLVARGLSTDEIARRLGLSNRAVQRRVAKLRLRFDVPSKIELTRFLAERGF